MTTTPTTINSADIVDFLASEMGGLASAFGWTNEDTTKQLTVDALFAAGVDSLSAVSGALAVRRFRAVLRVVAWRKAAGLSAGNFDFSADGGRYDRSQIHEHAKAMAAQAETDALAAGVDVSGLMTVHMHEVVDPDTESATEATEWVF